MGNIVRSVMAVLVLGLLLAHARAATPRYSITQLRAISTATDAYTTAYDINDNGIAVGVEGGPAIPSTEPWNPPPIDWTKTRPMKWDASATPAVLATLPGKGGEALAINNAGLIVGYSAASTGGQASTVFSTSAATAIPNGGGRAVDVNDAGVVLGFGGPTGNFRYLASTNTLQPLGTGSNQSGWEARTISPSGRMFANRFTGSGLTAGELFQSASPTFLFPPNPFAEFRDVNTHHVIAGTYSANSSGSMPAIFNGSTPTMISVPGAQFGSAAGINDRGMVLLSAYNSQTGYRPYVYDNGVLTAIDALLDNAGRWSNLFGIAINNRGQIVGQGRFDHDNNSSTPSIISGFRLDPVRSPGDTNSDRTVDFADLLTLAQNYGRSGNGNVFYETGDFNYDWSVDFTDLLTLAQHYNAPARFEQDWTLARSIVPEPAALGVMLLLYRPRRRRA